MGQTLPREREFGKAENTLRCLDAGKLDHLFANTETKARMRADIEQEQLRLVEIQWRRVQIRGRGGPGAATADVRRLWSARADQPAFRSMVATAPQRAWVASASRYPPVPTRWGYRRLGV